MRPALRASADTLDDAPGDHTCLRCGVRHLDDLEQHQPVCTGPGDEQ